MKEFRIRGTWYTIRASCIRQALLKLVDENGDFTYTPHWYTKSNRKSWAEFKTSYGYSGIVEEVQHKVNLPSSGGTIPPQKKGSIMKRTIKEPDGKHIIIYQDNGWQYHIKIYDDGTREEWAESSSK